MNAHNEQHDSASPVVKQNLTTQPAAAQEAVGWQFWHEMPGGGGEWRNGSPDHVVKNHRRNTEAAGIPTRNVYAAPVTAAPADAEEDAYVIGQTTKLLAEIAVIVNGPEPAGTRWSYHDLPAKVRALAGTPAAPADTWFADQLAAMGEVIPLDSTPAAPGIDMGAPGATLTIDGKTFTVDEVRAALLPGTSPKDELESWKRGTKACAEVLGQVMRQTQDSPKGGSEAVSGGGTCGRSLAKARDAWMASDEARMLANDRNGPVAGKYLRNRLEVAFCAGYDAAQAGDAEVQP